MGPLSSSWRRLNPLAGKLNKFVIVPVVLIFALYGVLGGTPTKVHATNLTMAYISQYQQLPSSYCDCGPAAIAMTERLYGINSNMSDSSLVQDARNKTGNLNSCSAPSFPADTDFGQLESALTQLGMSATEITNQQSPQPDSQMQAMKDATNSGKPVIAYINAVDLGRTYNGHWVVVTGFSSDGQTVYINDPDNQPPRQSGWTVGGVISLPYSTFRQAAYDAPVSSYGIIVGYSGNTATPTSPPSTTPAGSTPATPIVSTPSDWFVSNNGQAPTLCWNRSSNATEYYVEIYQSAVNTNSGWINGTCWQPTQLNNQYFNYQWHVKAHNSTGESSWSNTWHFSVVQSPTVTPTPKATATQSPTPTSTPKPSATPSPTPKPLVNGDFVQTPDGAIYRIVGGAPIFIHSMANYGNQPIRSISMMDLSALPKHPADGTFICATDNWLCYIMVGDSPVYLTSWAPYPSSHVTINLARAEMDSFPKTPLDGTFVCALDNWFCYIMVGGAPVYVHSWAPYPSSHTTVNLARAEINSFRNLPLDGTFFCATDNWFCYITVGGSPVYIHDWASYPSSHATVNLARPEIDSLPKTPVDGTFFCATDNWFCYITIGGSPVYIHDWASYPGAHATVNLARPEIDSLPKTPIDGTFFCATDNWFCYIIVGNSPVYIHDWASYPGSHTTVNLARPEIDSFRKTPLDGTYICATDNWFCYITVGGYLDYIHSWTPYLGSHASVNLARAELNSFSNTPLDGTFFCATDNWFCYRIAGGAPVYIHDWAIFGGTQPHINLARAEISVFPSIPADGTFLVAKDTGNIYEIVQKIPTKLQNWSVVGGMKPYVEFGQADINSIH